jgi:tetratricopeptide (TPR) repeat protein
MPGLSISSHLFSFAAMGLLGLLSFFVPAESPETAIKRFAQVFTAQDSDGLTKIIHQDILEGKEISAKDAERFLQRYRGKSHSLESIRIDNRLKSEDGKTERVQATLFFRGPALSSAYSGPTALEMTLLWVLEDRKWWLERPLSIHYCVTSTASYPTAEQEETAMRMQTALEVLEKLGIHGKEDLDLLAASTQGSAEANYRELEKLHRSESGPKGIDPKARGVALLLKAAAKSQPGLLRIYHGDFRGPAEDQRKPVPWHVFRDYAEAAARLGKTYEKRGELKKAEAVYRSLISLGRQFLNESEGLSFLRWGLTFQEMGARRRGGG